VPEGASALLYLQTNHASLEIKDGNATTSFASGALTSAMSTHCATSVGLPNAWIWIAFMAALSADGRDCLGLGLRVVLAQKIGLCLD
jgi:hypothetical protein